MTTTGTPVDNGVNTAALLDAREALSGAPQKASEEKPGVVHDCQVAVLRLDLFEKRARLLRAGELELPGRIVERVARELRRLDRR